MAEYAIGDVQGCFKTLEELLDRINFCPRRDRLWFVGDLVNRGAHSLEVLRFVRGLGDAAQIVLGNHDLHLCMRFCGFALPAQDETLQPVLDAPDCPDLIAWLRHQPLCRYEAGTCLVHAGLLPGWSVAQTLEYASEVEACLSSSNWRSFLEVLYQRNCTHGFSSLQGYARLRFIVNALTRLRLCSATGEINFKDTGNPFGVEAVVSGTYQPWFVLHRALELKQRVIFGHWSGLGLWLSPHYLGIDTGCVWGGVLTALEMHRTRIYQVERSEQDMPGYVKVNDAKIKGEKVGGA